MIKHFFDSDSIFSLFDQTFLNKIIEWIWPASIAHLIELWDIVLNDGDKVPFGLLSPHEWWTACSKLIQDAAKAPHVDLSAIGLSIDDFWCLPVACAHVFGDSNESLSVQLDWLAEVGEHDLSEAVSKHVVWLQVSMYNV